MAAVIGVVLHATTSQGAPFNLDAVNAMDHARFVSVLGAVFEKSPWVADAAWAKRPFTSRGALMAAMVAIVNEAPLPAQLGLLQAHPDLSGHEAKAGTMTASSVAEQASAGLTALSSEESAELAALNAAYRQKFGFPFIIAVRTRTKPMILAEFRTRLHNETMAEYANDLENVFIIARLRLEKLVSDP